MNKLLSSFSYLILTVWQDSLILFVSHICLSLSEVKKYGPLESDGSGSDTHYQNRCVTLGKLLNLSLFITAQGRLELRCHPSSMGVGGNDSEVHLTFTLSSSH